VLIMVFCIEKAVFLSSKIKSSYKAQKILFNKTACKSLGFFLTLLRNQKLQVVVRPEGCLL
jgi:hypothetical protein